MNGCPLPSRASMFGTAYTIQQLRYADGKARCNIKATQLPSIS